MSLLKRIENIIKSKINRLTDKLEDPRETLDYSYEKLVDQLKFIKQALVELGTAKNQLKDQKIKSCENLADLEAQAKSYVDLGGEDNEKLARILIEQKITTEQHIESLTTQIKDITEKENKLIQLEKEYEIKVNQFNAQKESVKAQYTAAESQKKISESLSGISDDINISDSMRKATDKTQSMNAKVAAIDDLTEKGVLTNSFDQRSSIQKDLDKIKNKQRIDDEISKMKNNKIQKQ